MNTIAVPKITLVIENAEYEAARENLESCIGETLSETVDNIRETLPAFKCGRGGSHVWISNPDNNERIAVIYF